MPEEAAEVFEDIGATITNWQTRLFTHSVWYTLIVAGIVSAVAFLLITLIKRLLAKKNQSNMHFFYRLLYVVIISVAVLMVMMTIRPLASFSTTILAGSGLLAVVIGIAAQAALGNVFSGISIGLSRPFVIGETIEVVGQDISGVVTEISLRQTIIRDANNKHIVVPNSVIDKEIIRTVRQQNRAVINYLRVGIGYSSDISRAMDIIRRAVMAHKDFYDTRTREDKNKGMKKDVEVLVTDLDDSAVLLRAAVWSKDASVGLRMLSDLRQTILREFQAQQIEIPYPYRNVRIQQEETETVQ